MPSCFEFIHSLGLTWCCCDLVVCWLCRAFCSADARRVSILCCVEMFMSICLLIWFSIRFPQPLFNFHFKHSVAVSFLNDIISGEILLRWSVCECVDVRRNTSMVSGHVSRNRVWSWKLLHYWQRLSCSSVCDDDDRADYDTRIAEDRSDYDTCWRCMYVTAPFSFIHLI